ncbi:hypothetical protein [Granulicella mallensis]|uniref:Uncharacterized protein n=1 Tax=Granulicella mallensis (strain ATCC BAA-1857 / DSM 23137 / MP5ACTX8) TaxID=682795 RepID=G8NTX5_GRAMM|nr:hypothetical protein [Granulicella mallensis]AEU37531.1 hypothetical protein AciX8_3230 [Granulicella mallensis MP5ACTX8]
MQTFFYLVLGMAILIVAALVPALTRQRQERRTRLQGAAGATRFDNARTHKADLPILLLLMLFFCGIGTIFFLWGWLDSVALRLLTTRAQQLRILYIAMRGASGVGVLGLAWFHARYAKVLGEAAWWKKLGNQVLLVFAVLTVICFVFDSAIRVVLVQTAQSPESIQATVSHVGTHRGKGTARDYADVKTNDGRWLSLESYRSLYALVTGYAIRVNGQCKVNTLTEGSSIVLHGRRSNFGFVLDSVTSSEPCNRAP